jgi:hypothetical protein
LLQKVEKLLNRTIPCSLLQGYIFRFLPLEGGGQVGVCKKLETGNWKKYSIIF